MALMQQWGAETAHLLESSEKTICRLVQDMIAHQKELQEYVHALESRVLRIEAGLLTAGPNMKYQESKTGPASTNADAKLEEPRLESSQWLPVFDTYPFAQQLGGDSHPAATRNPEERIAKLEELVEKISEVVSGQTHVGASEGQDSNADKAAVAPGGTDDYEVPMTDDESIGSSYTLGENTWDLAFLIGVPGVGNMQSAFVSIIVVLNFSLEVMLCVIINDVFTSPEIDRGHVADMRYWRVAFGHSTGLMNPKTYEPYARGVCRHKGGIQMVSEAVNLLSTIEEYMPTKELYEESNPVVGPILPYSEDMGLLLSLIAVLIWFLEISTAILSVRSKILAFYNTKQGDTTLIVDHKDSREVKSFTPRRKMLLLVLAYLELFILLCLGFSGMFFILYELRLQDLLLNCSALVVVLSVSERAFTALVPQREKSLLASLQALPRPIAKTLFGLSPSSYYSMAIIMCSTSFAFWHLRQQKEILADVHFEICGGNINFIAGPDGAGVMTAGFDAQVDGYEHMEKTYHYQAIRQLVLNEAGDVVDHRLSQSDMSAGASSIDGGPWSLVKWTDAPVNQVVHYWNHKCVDMLPISTGVYIYANHFLHILQDTTSNYDIHDCTHAKRWCNDDSEKGMRTRQTCSVTCGCNDPGSRNIILGDNGCSPTCSLMPDYNKSWWSRQCTDLEVDSPDGSQYWSQYSESLVQFLQSYSLAGGINMSEADFIAANGCAIVSKPMKITVLGVEWTDPCKVTSQRLKPFTHACPVSCNCRSDDPPPFCPASCR